jgi:ribosomal protein S18 acetylase RimI-like enzyme
MSSSPLRELREDDAEQVAALFADAYGEARVVDPEEVRSWLRNPEFEPGWLRVLEEDGRIAGYGDIWPQERDLQLDPAARDRWEPFFDWAEQEARSRGIPLVRVAVPHGHPLAAFAESRGYAPWRHSLTMEIELAEEPHRPQPPTPLELRPYRDKDHDVLIAALNEAFAEDPFWHHVDPPNFRTFYLEQRGFDPALWLLAWDGPELAGFALSYARRAADESLGWVGTLGVRAPWRNMGLGETLLRNAFAELFARGRRRVGLGVDAENVTGALRLYERVGMRGVGRTDNWQLEV